ncbi:hypothetical protein HKX48_005501 [Thoreauomyces humboldtii]|nr:hypothetical protein HKX48_005501 [Thoreauomyces humboldtii]
MDDLLDHASPIPRARKPSAPLPKEQLPSMPAAQEWLPFIRRPEPTTLIIPEPEPMLPDPVPIPIPTPVLPPLTPVIPPENPGPTVQTVKRRRTRTYPEQDEIVPAPKAPAASRYLTSGLELRTAAMAAAAQASAAPSSRASSPGINQPTPPDSDKVNRVQSAATKATTTVTGKRKSRGGTNKADEVTISVDPQPAAAATSPLAPPPPPVAIKAPTRASTRAKKPVVFSPTEPAHEHNTRKRGRPAKVPGTVNPPTTGKKPPKKGAKGSAATAAGRGSHVKFVFDDFSKKPAPSDDDMINNLVAFDASAVELDNPLLAQKKELIRKAKDDLLALAGDRVKMKMRCAKLALETLELESQAVQNGSHSCFAEVEARFSEDQRITAARKRVKTEWFQKQCEARVGQANTDFIVRRAAERQRLLHQYQELTWRLKEEKRDSDRMEQWDDEITVDARVKRRIAQIADLRRSATGLPSDSPDLPAYVKEKLQDNRKMGGRVIVPPSMCRGLRKVEMDLDLSIIRAANSYDR